MLLLGVSVALRHHLPDTELISSALHTGGFYFELYVR